MHFVDSQVSQVLPHSHTNTPLLHDYIEHAYKDAIIIIFFNLHHYIQWCIYVTSFTISVKLIHLKRPSSEHWGMCSCPCVELTALSCSH